MRVARTRPSRVRRLLLAALFAVTTSGALLGIAPTPAEAASPCQYSGGFLTDLNAARAAVGHPALSVSPQLLTLACTHSQQMAAAGTIWHWNIGTQLSGWSWVGENVGMGPSISALDAAFRASPPHYANWISTNYQLVGIAWATSGPYMYVTEEFEGLPQTHPTPPPTPTPPTTVPPRPTPVKAAPPTVPAPVRATAPTPRPAPTMPAPTGTVPPRAQAPAPRVTPQTTAPRPTPLIVQAPARPAAPPETTPPPETTAPPVTTAPQKATTRVAPSGSARAPSPSLRSLAQQAAVDAAVTRAHNFAAVMKTTASPATETALEVTPAAAHTGAGAGTGAGAMGVALGVVVLTTITWRLRPPRRSRSGEPKA